MKKREDISHTIQIFKKAEDYYIPTKEESWKGLWRFIRFHYKEGEFSIRIQHGYDFVSHVVIADLGKINPDVESEEERVHKIFDEIIEIFLSHTQPPLFKFDDTDKSEVNTQADPHKKWSYSGKIINNELDKNQQKWEDELQFSHCGKSERTKWLFYYSDFDKSPGNFGTTNPAFYTHGYKLEKLIIKVVGTTDQHLILLYGDY